MHSWFLGDCLLKIGAFGLGTRQCPVVPKSNNSWFVGVVIPMVVTLL